jgi:hypothetical protein
MLVLKSDAGAYTLESGPAESGKGPVALNGQEKV